MITVVARFPHSGSWARWTRLHALIALTYGLTLGCSQEGAGDPGPSVRDDRLAGVRGRGKSADHESGRRVSQEAAAIRKRADLVLHQIRTDPQALRDGNWVRVHWLLAFGSDADKHGHDRGEFHRLVDSLLRADPSTGAEAPFQNRRDKPVARVGGKMVNRQYHPDQFLAYLATVGVPLDAPLDVEGHRYSLRDLLDQSLREVRPAGELSWTLMAYTQYLAPDHRWRNKFGQELTVKTLISTALDHEESACGGTHYLNALGRILANKTWARSPLLQEICSEIRDRLRDRIARSRAEQRTDGSFVVDAALPDYLATPDRDVLIVYRTGHAFEWLSTSLPESELQDEWVLRGVTVLLEALSSERERLRSAGAESPEVAWRRANIGHAASGLARWADRLPPL